MISIININDVSPAPTTQHPQQSDIGDGAEDMVDQPRRDDVDESSMRMVDSEEHSDHTFDECDYGDYGDVGVTRACSRCDESRWGSRFEKQWLQSPSICSRQS